MEELIQRIVGSVGIDASTARDAVRAILSFLDRQGEADKVSALAARIPGWKDAVGAADDAPSDGGAFGGMTGGGAMAVLGELQALGLGMSEIQGVTREVVGFAREHAGRDAVDAVVASIPGLGQFV